MPALKPNTICLTAEEDSIITMVALSDSDAIPLTDAEWNRIKPKLNIAQSKTTQRIVEIIDYH